MSLHYTYLGGKSCSVFREWVIIAWGSLHVYDRVQVIIHMLHSHNVDRMGRPGKHIKCYFKVVSPSASFVVTPDKHTMLATFVVLRICSSSFPSETRYKQWIAPIKVAESVEDIPASGGAFATILPRFCYNVCISFHQAVGKSYCS